MTPSVDPTAGDLRELLFEVIARLERLEHAIGGRRREKTPLSGADQRRLELGLPAIGGQFGSELFFACDLLEEGGAGLRLVFGDLSVKAIGRLLLRAEGLSIGGYVVERDGMAAGVVQWRVVSEVLKPAITSRPSPRSSTMGSED